MMRLLATVVGLISSALIVGPAATQSPEDLARLTAFQQKIADYLRNLPNYTCTQRITFFRGQGNGDLFPIGRSEREVAVVYGREMYLERKEGEFAVPSYAIRGCILLRVH